jgi:hypothetical protein
MSEHLKNHNHNPGYWCEGCQKWQVVLPPPLPKELEELKEDPVLLEPSFENVSQKEVERQFIEIEGNEIEIIGQESNFDCGHTSLKMLGYDPSKIGRREATNFDVWNLTGKKPEDVLREKHELINPKVPYMVLVPTGDNHHLKREGVGHNHWVIRWGDRIIDPARGVIPLKVFEERYEGREMQAIKVPFKPSQPAQLAA